MYEGQIELTTSRNRKREPLKPKSIIKDMSMQNVNNSGDKYSQLSKESSLQSQKYYILHKVSATDTLQGICIKYKVTKYDLKIGNFLTCLFDVNDSLLLRNLIFIPFDRNKFCYGKTRRYYPDLVKIQKDCKDFDLCSLSKDVESELKTCQNTNKYGGNNSEFVLRVPVSFYRLRKSEATETGGENLLLVKMNHSIKVNKCKKIIRTSKNCFCDYPNLPSKHDKRNKNHTKNSKNVTKNDKNDTKDNTNVFDFNFFNSKLRLNNLSWLEEVVQLKNFTFDASNANTEESGTNTSFMQKLCEITDSRSSKNGASKQINEYISMVSLK